MFEVHIKNIIIFTAMYRYGTILGANLSDIIPSIAKPVRFDILDVSNLIGEISEATTAGVAPAILKSLNLEVIEKRFSTSPELKEMLKLSLILDPLSGVSYDDKMAMVADGTARKNDVIISNNINSFIARAMFEDINFVSLPRDKQIEVLNGYAQRNS
jgi:hypothetical protein